MPARIGEVGYAVLAAMADGKPHYQHELVAFVAKVWREQGRNPSSVHYALRALQDVGAVELVEGVVPARGTTWVVKNSFRITPEGRRLLSAQAAAWETLLSSVRKVPPRIVQRQSGTRHLNVSVGARPRSDTPQR